MCDVLIAVWFGRVSAVFDTLRNVMHSDSL